jgi:imidazolonepropionase-like amidohydrolase
MVTRGGFTPLDAIRSATQNGAWSVGQSAAIGTLEMGKAADIVLLGADPVADIRNTRAIVHVLQDGRVIR